MTSIRNKNHISTNPEEIKKVRDREIFIAFALDKIGVPSDHIGASALIGIAVDTWLAHGIPATQVILMLRQMADMMELDLVHKVEEKQCLN